MVPHYRRLRRAESDALAVPSGTGIGRLWHNSFQCQDYGLDTRVRSCTYHRNRVSTHSRLLPLEFSNINFRQQVALISTDSGVPTTVAASSTTKPIALSAVIGACVGAFIVVTAIIIFSFWVYKRYSKSLDKSRTVPWTSTSSQRSCQRTATTIP
jgi:hypothetical protein